MADQALLERILAAGSDHLPTFGGRYEGGLHLQQVPEELCEAIEYLRNRQYLNYLEIGAAAGGTARFLQEELNIPHVFIIDDNQHPKHVFRKHILPNAIEWIGDSHSLMCAWQLKQWGRLFDLVLIDGDHSYQGVRQDLAMVIPWLAHNAFVLLHDVLSMDGVRKLWEELNVQPLPILSPIKLCGQKLGIGILRFQSNLS